MRAREFISELSTVGTDPNVSQSMSSQPSNNSSNTQDTARVASMISGLQKQIQDLQKSALQTSANMSGSTPGTGTISPGQQSNQSPTSQQNITSQGPGQQTPGQQNATNSQPAPTVGLAGNKLTTPNPVPGVNQSPQVTNMKIKQQLAQNQGQNA